MKREEKENWRQQLGLHVAAAAAVVVVRII